MRIAVLGAGVSGCVAARLLASRHEVTLFEAGRHAGGHALTVDVELDGRPRKADVGFMVFNERTYPNFCRMLDLLGVESRASDMSFSVQDPESGLEYQGSGLRGLFAQRANALRPSFWRMLGEIARFNREATAAVASSALPSQTTVGDFLNARGFGERFRRCYLLPMASAIWSSTPGQIDRFPARFLLGFFANHGLLQLRDRPQWRTIVGGSREYVRRLLAGMEDSVRLNQPIARVERTPTGFAIHRENGDAETFDEVVFATHANQTRQLLNPLEADEQAILGGLPYAGNTAVLHTDASLLPKRPDAWASWNYRLTGDAEQPASVTYDLGRLQGVAEPGRLLLTLNQDDAIRADRVLRRFDFAHPAYSLESIAAQSRWAAISGRRGVHFCGAYWGYGFHEDGVRSALAVANHYGIGLEACTAACTKAPSPTTAASR